MDWLYTTNTSIILKTKYSKELKIEVQKCYLAECSIYSRYNKNKNDNENCRCTIRKNVIKF